MMRAAVMYAPGDIRVEDRPKPSAGQDEVLLKVAACGVCGSDIPRMLTKGAHRMPIICGHEFSGHIVELGANVRGFGEGELVAVIGRAGRRIPEHAAMDHVLGYTIMAENSVRDWQRHASQATAGKNFAASGAVGPWCVTRDVFAPDTTFRIITRVNGTVVQDGDTAQFIFSLPHVVAYVSTFTELLPGDLIALGTPSGVGMARTPPLWLRPGDLLEVEVSGIGTLRNRVVSDPAAGPVADTAQPERSQGQ